MDSKNIFYQIVQNKISSDIVNEDDYFMVIKDIKPQDEIHLLILPKNYYKDLCEFIINSSQSERESLWSYVSFYSKKIPNLSVVTNSGNRQDIPYLHVHLIGNGAQI